MVDTPEHGHGPGGRRGASPDGSAGYRCVLAMLNEQALYVNRTCIQSDRPLNGFEREQRTTTAEYKRQRDWVPLVAPNSQK